MKKFILRLFLILLLVSSVPSDGFSPNDLFPLPIGGVSTS